MADEIRMPEAVGALADRLAAASRIAGLLSEARAALPAMAAAARTAEAGAARARASAFLPGAERGAAAASVEAARDARAATETGAAEIEAMTAALAVAEDAAADAVPGAEAALAEAAAEAASEHRRALDAAFDAARAALAGLAALGAAAGRDMVPGEVRFYGGAGTLDPLGLLRAPAGGPPEVPVALREGGRILLRGRLLAGRVQARREAAAEAQRHAMRATEPAFRSFPYQPAVVGGEQGRPTGGVPGGGLVAGVPGVGGR